MDLSPKDVRMIAFIDQAITNGVQRQDAIRLAAEYFGMPSIEAAAKIYNCEED